MGWGWWDGVVWGEVEMVMGMEMAELCRTVQRGRDGDGDDGNGDEGAVVMRMGMGIGIGMVVL